MAALGSIGVLAGCAASGGAAPAPSDEASTAADAAPTAAPTPPDVFAQAAALEAAAEGLSVDPVAQARADGWLDSLPMPDEAVAWDEDPGTAPGLDWASTDWWCAPMAFADRYWAVDGWTVADTHDRLAANVADGLIATGTMPMEHDPALTSGLIGHVPDLASLEGMAIEFAPSDDGIVIHAHAGAFGEATACPTPAPGEGLGGPGQG
ncbi:hypothetical protein [Agrococcus terreus]|uniref:Lipoprotein n=1 Tax=Agrococcus terreus TaxID=574649 RepID=A0ABQ2KIP9_9MICO|nr:hypothetical protein [Agrococcus terreus]GGN84345.1 hypothetical protein GCM10010968_15990 [Agrococcus terreus]